MKYKECTERIMIGRTGIFLKDSCFGLNKGGTNNVALLITYAPSERGGSSLLYIFPLHITCKKGDGGGPECMYNYVHT